MNAPMIQGMNLTMSSREIAELTGKRHDHVTADIKTMLDQLGIQSPEFSGHYKDGKGRKQPCFNLPKRETLILVSGYNIQMRAKIIDRWQELEAQVAQPYQIPKSFAEALALAAQTQAEKEAAVQKAAALEAKVIEDKPKVDFYPAAQIRH